MKSTTTENRYPTPDDVRRALDGMKDIIYTTPLTKNQLLSDRYQANIYLKREDLQVVRSYKIRGAYNKISTLSAEEMERGIVCASAGNHA